MMNRPKGGRGLKAEYPTKMVRVPIVLEHYVQKLVDNLHSGNLAVDSNGDLTLVNPSDKETTKTE